MVAFQAWASPTAAADESMRCGEYDVLLEWANGEYGSDGDSDDGDLAGDDDNEDSLSLSMSGLGDSLDMESHPGFDADGGVTSTAPSRGSYFDDDGSGGPVDAAGPALPRHHGRHRHHPSHARLLREGRRPPLPLATAQAAGAAGIGGSSSGNSTSGGNSGGNWGGRRHRSVDAMASRSLTASPIYSLPAMERVRAAVPGTLSHFHVVVYARSIGHCTPHS